MTTRETMVAGCLLLSLVALPTAGWRLWSAQAELSAAAEQLAECQQLKETIEQLQAKPEVVSVKKRTESEIHGEIVASAERFKLPILRISSPVASQIPDSPYVEQSISLDIRAVELKQLVRFLKDLTAGDDKHDIAAIRLTEPRTRTSEASKVDSWKAELTITSWTYAKK